MEWVILSSLLAISPVGFILDAVIANRIRQFAAVEQLEVRVDNAPSYQILQGKVERLRIAGRGIEPIADFRIEALELETDPIAVDLNQLQSGAVQEAFKQLQGGVRLVITEADINQALRSPLVQEQLQQLIRGLPGATQARGYRLITPLLELDGERLRIRAELQRSGTDESLRVSLESGVAVKEGHTLLLVEPAGTINDRPLSPRLLQGIAQGLSQRLDLRRLEEAGITARLLQLEVRSDQISVAAFVRVEGATQKEHAGF